MKKYLAEGLGTFALVFCGTGAIVVDQISPGAITHVGIALTFGLVVTVMVYSFGAVSGAHLNPAVTVGFWILKRFPSREVAPYVTSQVLGAFTASGLLRLLFPESATLGETLPKGPEYQSFVLEVILTFMLMLVIIQVSEGAMETRWFAGIAVGATVLLEAMFAGPVCGASMNPARSLAPALCSGHTESLWIYLTAPLAGAALAIIPGRILSGD